MRRWKRPKKDTIEILIRENAPRSLLLWELQKNALSSDWMRGSRTIYQGRKTIKCKLSLYCRYRRKNEEMMKMEWANKVLLGTLKNTVPGVWTPPLIKNSKIWGGRIGPSRGEALSSSEHRHLDCCSSRWFTRGHPYQKEQHLHLELSVVFCGKRKGHIGGDFYC